MLDITAAREMFHKFFGILSAYVRRSGVTDHSGHLTNGYAFMNVFRNVTSVERE